MSVAQTNRPQRGDEQELYRRHHDRLLRAVGLEVTAPPETIEDACQTAWLSLLRYQPDRSTVYAWLRTVAIHAAWDLAAVERRAGPLWSDEGEALLDPCTLELQFEAREALRTVASLRPRQRTDLSLLVGGFSYREIRSMTGPRTHTNVSKHIAKARAGVRRRRIN